MTTILKKARFFLMLFAVVIIQPSCTSQKTETTISGNLQNTALQLDVFLLELDYMPTDDIQYISTKRDAEGNFSISMEPKESKIYYLISGKNNIQKKFNSEIKKLLSKSYYTNYSLSTRRNGSIFLPISPGQDYNISIDFNGSKTKNKISYKNAGYAATDVQKDTLLAFWEMEELVENIQFEQLLSNDLENYQPKEMPGKEANKIIFDQVEKYIEIVNQEQLLNPFLKTYFCNEINFKARNVLIQYYEYVHYSKIMGHHLGTLKFISYKELFDFTPAKFPTQSRQYCQFIEHLMTYHMGQKTTEFKSFFEMNEQKYSTAKEILPENIKKKYLLSRINHIKRVNKDMHQKLLSRYQHDFTALQ